MKPPRLALALLLVASRTAPAQQAGLLDIDSLLAIEHPSGAAWSPDGERVAFVSDRAGVQNLYVVDAVGGWPTPLTRYGEGLIEPPFWSADSRRLYFERDGDLWSVGDDGAGPPVRVFGTEATETGARLGPDGRRVAFLRLGDVWVRELSSGREKRLTVTLASESDLRWSPDGEHIAFTYSRSTPREELAEWAGSKIAFRRVESEPGDVGVVATSGGAVTALGATPAAESFPRWLDGRRLTLQRVSSDQRKREILLADVTSGETTVLHADEDERWWSLGFLGAEPRPSPDGKLVAFVSDRTGWDQLYAVSIADGKLHPLTSGEQEIRRFAFSPDGRRIAYDTNLGHSGRRHLAVVALDDLERPRMSLLTNGRGTNVQPPDASGFALVRDSGGWSPDGDRILFQHTDPRRSADLFWVASSPRGEAPHELTFSLPLAVDRSRLVEPELVHYPSKDGRPVPAYLFVPPGLDRSRKHPAIVWVHGDGIAQNYDGWHPRRDYAVYYAFHQYLVQRGYVVIAPDYRGSVGYGREWRVAPYRDLGGADYEDVAAATSYLESLLYVDAARIGVWGLSYGGFLTLTALTRDPLLFRCGVDVAGVHDFRYWQKDPGGSWVEGRLGSPSQNPEAYLRAAPVERAASLSRPLLVLHGTADVNVPFLETLHLVDELLKKGKDVELAVYPGEYHYFHRAHVLRDAWRRVDRFFGRYLAPEE